MNRDEPHRVVVTGTGAVTPIGLTVESTWEAMLEGKSGGAPVSYFDASSYRSKIACELKGFDPQTYIDRKLSRRLDPYAQYALVASEQALSNASFDSNSLSRSQRERVGVIFGTTVGGFQVFQDQADVLRYEGPRRISPFFLPMLTPNMASGQIAKRHGFRGSSYANVSSCATGNHCLGQAAMLIRHNYLDAVLCGGSEAPITELCHGGLCSMRALSTRNHEPAQASRPFDAGRDGFVVGEGAGALLLESLENAQARGAKIHAELIGFGASTDTNQVSEPEQTSVELAISSALEDATARPEDIDYINMQGSSTQLGDAIETRAIKSVFGKHAHKLKLSSTKGMTGHLLGGSAAVEAVATVLSIQNDVVPPTINFEKRGPDCDLDYTFNRPGRQSVETAVNNAFGMGGHNAAVVFGKYSA